MMKYPLPFFCLWLCGCAAPTTALHPAPVAAKVMPPAPPGFTNKLASVSGQDTAVPLVVAQTWGMTMQPYWTSQDGIYFLQASADLISWKVIATNSIGVSLDVEFYSTNLATFFRTGFGQITN